MTASPATNEKANVRHRMTGLLAGTGLGGRGPVQPALVQLRVLAVGADIAACNEHARDRRAQLQRIAIPDHQVGELAWCQAADLVSDAEDFSSLDGERAEG